MGYQYLALAQFAVSAGTSIYNKNRADALAETQRADAYKQVALNNQLSFNAQLNLNRQEQLELISFGFDKFELSKNIRRERATSAAIQASFGGSFGRQGRSVADVQLNIARYGFLAMARKDLNFKVKTEDFRIRRGNIFDQTVSQNNQAFSGLSTGGDAVGTGLQILSSGLNIYDNYKEGTRSVRGNNAES